MAKKKTAKSTPRDGFQPEPGNVLAEQHELLSAWLDECEDRRRFHDFDLNEDQTDATIHGMKPDEKCQVISAALERIQFSSDILDKALEGKPECEPWRWTAYLRHLVDALLRKKLPIDEDLLTVLLEWGAEQRFSNYQVPYVGIVKAVENFAKTQDLPPAVADAAEACLKNLMKTDRKEERKFIERLEAVLGTEPEIRLTPGEAWSDAVLDDLGKMNAKRRRAWIGLIAHCLTAAGGAPKKKWLDQANTLLKAVKVADFKKRVAQWFPLVDKPRTQVIESWSEWVPNPNLMIIDPHADILKGLVWCCGRLEDAQIARSLTALAISAYKKIPGRGPRAVKVGNACVHALGAMPGTDAVGQLAVLKVRVKFGTAQKGIEKALVATAERVGIPRNELEEMSVPAYGLTEVGRRTESLGEFTAEVRVAGRKPTLHWFKPDGKEQKSVPAAVKKDFGDDLKELRQAVKDIEKMLPAQSARIEQTYLEQREWKLPVWHQRYLDHPLVGTLASRLIWLFRRGKNKAAAIRSGDGFVDHRDKAVDWPDDATTVRLWHPLDANTKEITAWRDWLIAHEVRQPFKQAHREVYILTDAERNTRTYSNRFAAHVLKQHQFNALCRARNWKNTLRLMVDDEFPPAHIELPSWNLRVEFWVEGAGEEYGVDTNEAGTYLYLTTDQVRFYQSDAAANRAHATGGGYASDGTDREENQPLDLDRIPPLVLSEILRDVDLFVGVASVGNDPNWADGGPEGQYRDYWQSYSFGELGATAATRKAVLEGLVPRLKIADRCKFSDRFLIVRGDIRTYRIHLGSGNILMEPNDEYLCIMPKQTVAKKSDAVFLPFEGDNTMSIILSKALLLADDKKIKDSTIVSQIKR